ncbi:MAG: hypothetical protein K5656_11960 [Lachnospiraceae bacterium]|nr:hypothetical protein [Lachnospiraceae bacterium]
MINTDKVRLMTKCACYIKNEESKNLSIANFFKRDYVRWNVLKSLVSATLGYILLVLLFALCKYNEIFLVLNQLKYKEIVVIVLVGWLATMVIYFVIAELVYRHRFEQARPGVTEYYKTLKKIKRYYRVEKDNSPRMLDEEGDLNNDEFIDY